MTPTRKNLIALLQPGEVLEITIWKNEQDEEGTTFLTVIEKALGDSILVSCSQAVHEKFSKELSLPIVVGALYGTGPAPYMFYPTLKYFDSEETGFSLLLPMEMDIQLIQQRSFARINVKVPIVIETDIDLPAYTLDISGGGLQFVCAKQFPPGTMLNLQIRFQSDNPAICVKAKSVVSRENMRSHRAEDSMATCCQFVNMNEATQQRLMGECFRIELSQKKHLQG